MATLQSLTINDTGYFTLPSGTTAQRPGSPSAGMIRHNTDTDRQEYYDGTVWRDLSTHFPTSELGQHPGYAGKTGSQIKTVTGTTTSGFYWLNPVVPSSSNLDIVPPGQGNTFTTGPFRIWVDMNYQGGGWHLVLSNRLNGGSQPWRVGGMRNLDWTHATGPYLNYRGNTDSNLDFQAFVGMSLWNGLAPGATKTVAQIVHTSPVTLNQTSPTKRARWSYTSFGNNWNFVGAATVALDAGGEYPGFYSYHAANSYELFTWDRNGTNACPGYYSNNPWWYGGCWDGNGFGGGDSGGYADAWFWSGSGSDYHNYGAAYIK
jgi:hypothetical protein